MLLTSVFAAGLAALSLDAPPSQSAPPHAPPVRQYREVALSPSGDRAASVESVQTSDGTDTAHGRILVRSRAGQVLIALDPCASCRYGGPSFSPDGRSLAFAANDAKSGAADIYVAGPEGVRRAAHLSGSASAPRWSPDGRRLAFLAIAGAHKEVGATQAGRPQTGEIGADADEQRIALASAAGGAPRFVSPADTWVYEYAWTPDQSGFVATAAPGDGDDNWWIAKLVAFDAASGAERVIAAPNLQMNAPEVSPDGASVAFIGGLMSDFGAVGGDVYVVPLAGGDPRDVTPGLPGSAFSLNWTEGGLLAGTLMGADDVILRVGPGAAPVRLATLPVWVAGGGGLAFSRDGAEAALSGSTFTTPPALLIGPLQSLRPVSHENDGLHASVTARSLTWRSDGFSVQGWLLTPTAPAAGPLAPMVTVVHGGPSSATTPNFVDHGLLVELSKAGYYVFLPNPRGSYGQGEAFTRANVRDLGGGDLRDILTGIDTVERAAPVDDRRLGLYGHSYGGFMTMWGVTHTGRFKAAVAGAGVSDWVSYYGENGIDKWMIPFFGSSAYEDPAIYDKLSPIRFIRAARTPTFLYVGERDVECPAPQSIEFWHGLREMNVPTRLVIYPGEGHGIRKPEDVRDLAQREIGWFDQYLRP